MENEDIKNGISIGFDAKRAFFNFSGLGNYSRNLLAAMVKYFPGNSYTLFTPSTKNRIILQDEERFKIISPELFILNMAGRLWRMKYMVNDIKRQNIQIFHGLSQELPYGIEKCGVRSVVTVHDLIFLRFPHYYKWFDSEIYTRKMKHACQVSDKIIAISKQTCNDLMEFLGVPREKISVIYQGCNSWFWNYHQEDQAQEIRTKYNLPERYLLYVSTIEERKNLLGVLKAMKICRIDVPLVVIGRKSDLYFREVQSYISANNLKNIIFPGGIINTELPSIYKHAECFIYPSFFEGFGIPILEALVSGIPVITTRGGCFAESGGPGSIYIDPHNPEEIGEAILKVISDRELRAKMITTGKEYSSGFREDIIAAEYMKLYHSLL